MSPLVFLAGVLAAATLVQEAPPSFLSWSQKQAESIGAAMRVQGRVGSAFDLRLLKTERSYNYKLMATWLTPDVIRATARLRQLTLRISNAEARDAAEQAISRSETTFMVEIDPREGSGVIPVDWLVLLVPKQGKEDAGPAIRGVFRPEHRENPLLAGVIRRNYDYDRFWVDFPMTTGGRPAIPVTADSIDLIARIYEKEGRVSWPLKESMTGWFPESRQ